MMNYSRTTPANYKKLAERLLAAQVNGDYGAGYGPCEGIHSWLDSCVDVPLDRFIAVFRWMFPIYGALHLVPAVLFKRKDFWENPWKMLLRAGVGTTRSSAFLGVFVVIYQSEFLLSFPVQILIITLSFFLCKLSFALNTIYTNTFHHHVHR